jgi:hypothetical protein
MPVAEVADEIVVLAGLVVLVVLVVAVLGRMGAITQQLEQQIREVAVVGHPIPIVLLVGLAARA